ncbi:MAG: cell division protein FtsZ, partial [Wenzhouxiangellaceae bacterium]
TVVATGLGRKHPARQEKPMKIVRTGTDDRPVFEEDEIDAPAQPSRERDSGSRQSIEQKELEYLDIPAFLRNQAD